MFTLPLLFLLAQLDFYEQGTAYLRAGRLPEAEAALRRHLQTHPRHWEALANLGAVLSRREDYAGAIAQYRKALALAPHLAPLRLNLGLAYFKQQDWGNALPEFDLFLASQPGHRQTLQLRALTLLELERYAEAVAAFSALRPADATVDIGLATAYLRLGRPAEAQNILAPLLERGDSPEVLLTVGQALVAEDRLDEALEAFVRVRRLAPSLPTLQLHIGAIHWRNKRFADAVAEWRGELAQHPDSAEAKFTLGSALAQSGGDKMEAERLLRASLKPKPRHAKANYQLGKLLWQAKRNGEALTCLEAAVKADPDYREAHFLLGGIYRTLGRKALADREFAAVKRLSAKQLSAQQDLFSEPQ